MKAAVIFSLAIAASFLLGACERHSFDETSKALHGHGKSESHDARKTHAEPAAQPHGH